MMDQEIDPALLELVRDGMGDAVPFARHAGVRLDEVHDGSAVASLADAPEVLNHVATVHAGALFTLAEAASGAAMAGAFAPVLFEVRPVVSAAAIEYARPAHAPVRAVASAERDGAELRADLERDGRATFDVRVSLVDGRARDVATFRATWVVKRLAAPA